MKHVKWIFAAIGITIVWLVFAQPVKATIASAADQISISVIIDVTPSPLAYQPNAAPASNPGEISATMKVAKLPEGSRSALNFTHTFEAQSLHFEQVSSLVVAQSQVQHPVLVQAEISPNPNATLLYASLPGVEIGVQAGTKLQVPCAFTVTVDSTKTWELEEGLSNDFATGFPGGDLANDTYLSTPKPTSTPYAVYADDGGVWSVLSTGDTKETYCVTLTITVPASMGGGAYSSNAIYTLYYE